MIGPCETELLLSTSQGYYEHDIYTGLIRSIMQALSASFSFGRAVVPLQQARSLLGDKLLAWTWGHCIITIFL